jgi:type I restriction enzyme R subunit
MSNFIFLKNEWPEVLEPAAKAEGLAYSDPRAACFYTRRALELAIAWLYKHDAALRLPYQDSLNALIHEPTFRNSVGSAVFTKAKVIKDLGNFAVHSHKAVRQYDALCAVRELFHFSYWLAHTYGRGEKPAPDLAFDAEVLAKAVTVPKQTQEQLQRLASDLKERDEKLSVLLADKENLDEELKRLRAEIAAVKKANAERPDTHDYSEAQTRDYFIDLLLKEAGWALDQERDREFPVTGMPNEKGEGFVDYVLWGDDGLPLALVEAKRSRRDARVGQQQAKLYADCLEKQFGKRPVIYYSNGYEHWLWDDATSPPRAVQGFHKKDELELMIQRRQSRRPLAEAPINEAIVERYYQTRAIRRIGEAFQKDGDRKALVVMATGAGKTRTVIALCDLLMRCNWAKRVLFLADRVSLVNQAEGNFKKHLPSSSPVNLVTEKHENGRVFVSTYATMMGLIDQSNDGHRRFGIGHFDIIVIDEAHRSVFQKYRAIFDYFDSFLVGLTATPKEEVDRNTYGLFDLENGVPTDAYTLEDAVKDGYLVPPKAVSVPLKFQRDGIKYEDLTEEEKEKWDALEWDEEEGAVPDKVKAEAINKWLFNIDTVDKVLAHVMTHGLKVAGGDRLGKTIIFAKNQAHADFIQERFDINYPNLKGEFARVITFKTEYAQTLIDNFSTPEKTPHIAISVDMLDTGIDVPEVVNLVFFKIVRSKTKFWQMVGRGTRLRPDLFGPDKPKECFFIFDYCQNLEFFSENPDVVDGAAGEPLGKRLFKARLELISEIDQKLATRIGETMGTEEIVRKEVAGLLQTEVAAMNIENFVVRSKRRFVERYAAPEAWERLTLDARHELAGEVAGLPSELEPEDEDAKRFDLLLLNLQLALMKAEPAFDRLSKQVQALASGLEANANIPMIRDQLDLIQNIQTEEWWQYVTVEMLDNARKRLRLLIKLIDKKARKVIISDFEDQMGEGTTFDLPGFSAPDTFEKFRAKARQFLLAHEGHLTVHKLRSNIPLTKTDLRELERILVESGIGTPEDVVRAKEASHGLGLFVRSLVGMEREAAKNAMSAFLKGRTPTANQIQFLEEIVNHLTANGVMEAARLYEAPYTYIHDQGVEGVFKGPEIDELISILEEVKNRAIA